MVNTLTDANFTSFVQGNQPVLVEFGATWCGPCKALAPIVEDIAEEYGEKLGVATIDVDDNPKTTTDWHVMSVPTLMVFQNGTPVKQLVGYRPKAQLLEALAELLS